MWKALAQRGLKVFLDVRGLGAGRFDTNLRQRIEDAPDFMVLLTPGALDRCREEGDVFAAEIAHALKSNRNIVPLKDKDFTFPAAGTLPSAIEPLLRYHAVDYDHGRSDESIGQLYGMLRSGAARRARRRWLASASLVLLAGIIGAASWSSWGPRRAEDVSPAAATARELSYSVIVQKYRNGQPFQDPFVLASEINFETDYQVRLIVHGPGQPGYLYIVNEGPPASNGMPTFNILFPSTMANAGSALLAAAQQVRIPEQSWFVFDQEAGTEIVWLVWASRSVPELEAVKGLANPNDQGAVSKVEQIAAIRDFLAARSKAPPKVRKDEVKKQTTVTTATDPLVYALRLEHH